MVHTLSHVGHKGSMIIYGDLWVLHRSYDSHAQLAALVLPQTGAQRLHHGESLLCAFASQTTVQVIGKFVACCNFGAHLAAVFHQGCCAGDWLGAMGLLP